VQYHLDVWWVEMKSDVELIAKAEAVLDRTLAYQAAQAIHEL
jgi:hypothetical protein